MKLSWTLASLFLLQAAHGASADCSDHNEDCLACVEADCAITSEAQCVDTCDDVTALIDCFAIDNYKGLDGPELCEVAGFEVISSAQEGPSLLPDISAIGGHASIGEDNVEAGAAQACATPEEGVCTLEYVPVVCLGDCQYDNACIAELSGYDPSQECVLVDEVDNVGAEACPTPGPGMCTLENEPVLCSGSCEYSNACAAELAGFDASTECVLVNPPAPDIQTAPPMTPGEGGSPTGQVCPQPAAGTMCTMEYEPVVCGGFNCQYSNACQAEAAGYDSRENCALVEPPMGGGPMDDHNMTAPMHNMTDGMEGSPCSQLPTCESCLSARMDCKWTAGSCYEECIADASCWSPMYQVNMTMSEMCELASQEGFADEGVADLEVVTERQVNTAQQEQVSESAAVRPAVWATVAFVAALGAAMV